MTVPFDALDLGCRSLRQERRTVYRDLAATVTTGVIQIIHSAPAGDLRQHIEALLRDEFADLTQQIMSERDGFDE